MLARGKNYSGTIIASFYCTRATDAPVALLSLPAPAQRAADSSPSAPGQRPALLRAVAAGTGLNWVDHEAKIPCVKLVSAEDSTLFSSYRHGRVGTTERNIGASTNSLSLTFDKSASKPVKPSNDFVFAFRRGHNFVTDNVRVQTAVDV